MFCCELIVPGIGCHLEVNDGPSELNDGPGSGINAIDLE